MTDLEAALRPIVAKLVADELAKHKPANDYLSIAEAADIARVSPYTIRRWVRVGALTRHEAGARILVRREELEKHLTCEVVSIDSKLSPGERARRRFG